MGKRRRTRRGGGIIGKGMTGDVHYPAIPCKDKTMPPGDNVTKVVKSKETAESELEKYTSLNLERFNDFAIAPFHMCEGEDSTWNLYSRYGVTSLTPYHDHFEKPAYSKDVIPTDADMAEVAKIIKCLDDLRLRIEAMNAAGVYHNDLSFDNITYDSDNSKLYIIDFDRASTSPATKRDDVGVILSMQKDFRVFQELMQAKLSRKGGSTRRKSRVVRVPRIRPLKKLI